MATHEDIYNYVASPHSVNVDDWNALAQLAGWGFLYGFIVVVGLVLIWIFASKTVSSKLRDISLKWSFIAVWIFGFLVYDVGMCTGQKISLLTNAPMAIIYAFKIFLFDSDVSEIHEVFHSSWMYSLCFALAHFFAAIISTLFLIKHFGFNIMARLRLWWASRRFRSKNIKDTYIFWGLNDATCHLIEDIKKEKGESNDYRIIIVRTNREGNESPAERTGFARLFNLLSMPNSEFERLENLTRCLSVGSYVNPADFNETGDQTDVIGSLLKLKSLKAFISNRAAHKVHLLFLSDDEQSNIHDVALLLKDSTINAFVNGDPNDRSHRAIFYCLARYNSVHRVIEDQYTSDRIKVKVVDSSHLSVEQLKLNPDLLPVNYVDVDASARVSSAFNALVIGFSEVGQDSVQFLYEYGAFVKAGGSDEIAVRSDFHLHVVDKNMADLAGSFVANAPAISPSMPFIEGCTNPDALITLHKLDCRSAEFYLKLEEWIKTLNYIVIATDNDELNISLGVRIFKLATRYRRDMTHFCILVRAHSDDDGHIQRIALHYNRLWAAYDEAPEVDGKRIHQTTIRVDAEITTPIHVFGLDSTTFTYANIIADTMEKKARMYQDRYVRTLWPDKEIKQSAREDTFRDVMQFDDKYQGFSPTYFGMLYLRRTRMQDDANYFHELTKSLLAQKALQRCHLDLSYFKQLTRQKKTTRYQWPKSVVVRPEITTIATVLAQTEHLRWNASHEILGYSLADEKHEVRMEHDCLKDWSELGEITRSYDFNVTDFILDITITLSDS